MSRTSLRTRMVTSIAGATVALGLMAGAGSTALAAPACTISPANAGCATSATSTGPMAGTRSAAVVPTDLSTAIGSSGGEAGASAAGDAAGDALGGGLEDALGDLLGASGAGDTLGGALGGAMDDALGGDLQDAVKGLQELAESAGVNLRDLALIAAEGVDELGAQLDAAIAQSQGVTTGTTVEAGDGAITMSVDEGWKAYGAGDGSSYAYHLYLGDHGALQTISTPDIVDPGDREDLVDEVARELEDDLGDAGMTTTEVTHRVVKGADVYDIAFATDGHADGAGSARAAGSSRADASGAADARTPLGTAYARSVAAGGGAGAAAEDASAPLAGILTIVFAGDSTSVAISTYESTPAMAAAYRQAHESIAPDLVTYDM